MNMLVMSIVIFALGGVFPTQAEQTHKDQNSRLRARLVLDWELLRSQRLCEELQISSEQQKKLEVIEEEWDKAWKSIREERLSGKLPSDQEYKSKRVQVQHKAFEEISKVLDPMQQERLMKLSEFIMPLPQLFITLDGAPAQVELNLSMHQKIALEELRVDFRKAWEPLVELKLTRDVLDQRYTRLVRQLSPRAMAILTPAQQWRLEQIRWQQFEFVWPLAASPLLRADIAEKLELTDEQKHKIQTLCNQVRELRKGKVSFREEKQLSKENSQKALSVLSEEQKKRWGSILGEPYFHLHSENKKDWETILGDQYFHIGFIQEESKP